MKEAEAIKKMKKSGRADECGKVTYGAMKWLFWFSLVAQIPLAIISALLEEGIGFREGLIWYYAYPVAIELVLLFLMRTIFLYFRNRIGFRIYAVIVLVLFSIYSEVMILAYPKAILMPLMLLLPITMLSVFRDTWIMIFQMALSMVLYLIDDFFFLNIEVGTSILWKVINLLVFGIILVCFFIVEEQVRNATTMLDIQTSKDSLTGLYNHEAFYVRLEKQMEEYKLNQKTFSIFIADIDNFKKVNDTYGHVYGDEVLETVSSIILGEKGSKDFASRYGGEEFAMILPNCEKQDAIGKANRIRKKMESNAFETEDGEKHFTISIGVAEYTKDFESGSKFVDLADNALYEAKASGKNRVCFRK